MVERYSAKPKNRSAQHRRKKGGGVSHPLGLLDHTPRFVLLGIDAAAAIDRQADAGDVVILQQE